MMSLLTCTVGNVVSRFAGDTGGGISRDDYIDKIASDVLGKLPEEFDLDKVRKKFGLEISPTTVVLLQELERFNKLIKRMRLSLQTLRRVSVRYTHARCCLDACKNQ